VDEQVKDSSIKDPDDEAKYQVRQVALRHPRCKRLRAGIENFFQVGLLRFISLSELRKTYSGVARRRRVTVFYKFPAGRPDGRVGASGEGAQAGHRPRAGSAGRRGFLDQIVATFFSFPAHSPVADFYLTSVNGYSTSQQPIKLCH
jgi:hypothetical protein